MPRNPINNPIERLDRLLSEYEEALFVLDQYRELLLNMLAPKDFQSLPARPPREEFRAEKVRQSLSYGRSRANRANMQLARSRGGLLKDLRAAEANALSSEMAETFSVEEIEALLAKARPQR